VSDEMIDLMAGDMRLRRRLEAYAEVRLSPDTAATSRIRARVLAHAHRQADLARADAALTIVPPSASITQVARRRRNGFQRAAIALVAAAGLVGAMVGGAAAASGPGQAFYEARLWVETLTLPADPSERALAQLDRLAERLREAEAAARNGDQRAAAAALAAYEAIVEQASAAVLAAGDPVAAAAFETGIGRNVEVLQALIDSVPSQAVEAISLAVERAIERSGTAIDTVHDVDKPNPPAGGEGGGAGPNGGNPPATAKPNRTPNPRPEATSKPTRTPNDRPEATPKPNAQPQATPKPTRTPRPTNEAPPPRGQPQGNPPD
jgi:hypothetical protein